MQREDAQNHLAFSSCQGTAENEFSLFPYSLFHRRKLNVNQMDQDRIATAHDLFLNVP